MTEKELRKLNRRDLLEMLIFQTRRCEDLEGKLRTVQEKLDDKNISLTKAGSISQAALQLSGIFEAADEAAYRYLDSIRNNLGSADADPNDIYESLRSIKDYSEEKKKASSVVYVVGDASGLGDLKNAPVVRADGGDVFPFAKSEDVSSAEPETEVPDETEPEQVYPTETDVDYGEPVFETAPGMIQEFSSDGETKHSVPLSASSSALVEEIASDYESDLMHEAECRVRDYEHYLRKQVALNTDENREEFQAGISTVVRKLEKYMLLLMKDQYDSFLEETKKQADEIWISAIRSDLRVLEYEQYITRRAQDASEDYKKRVRTAFSDSADKLEKYIAILARDEYGKFAEGAVNRAGELWEKVIAGAEQEVYDASAC